MAKLERDITLWEREQWNAEPSPLDAVRYGRVHETQSALVLCDSLERQAILESEFSV